MTEDEAIAAMLLLGGRIQGAHPEVDVLFLAPNYVFNAPSYTVVATARGGVGFVIGWSMLTALGLSVNALVRTPEETVAIVARYVEEVLNDSARV